MKTYLDIFNFLGNTLPLVAWVVMAVTLLVMFGRDRYNRRIRLNAPPEEQAIENLRNDGTITPEEAQLLTQNCGVLPVPEEVAPVPDLMLRMAVAVCKIYAGLQLILFICFGLSVLFMFGLLRFDRHVSFTPNASFSSWALVLPVLGLGLALVLFMAPKRVLNGSLLWRNIMVGAWMLSFVVIIENFYARYWMVLAGLFVIYAFYWRRGANAKIAARVSGPKGWHKLAVSGVAVVMIVLGTCTDFRVTASLSTAMNANTFSSVRGDQITPYLEKIYILVGTPEPETAAVAAGLAKVLPQPCEVVPYGAPVLSCDRRRAMIFWLGRGQVSAPEAEAELSGVPKELRKQLPIILTAGSDIQKSYAGKPAYVLRSLQPDHFRLNWGSHVTIPDFNFSFRLTEAAKRDSNKAGIEQVVNNMAGKLNPLLRRFRGPDAVQLPEFPERFRAKVPSGGELEVPGVSEWRKLASSDNIEGGGNELYTFTRGDWESDLVAVSAALAKRGLHPDKTENRADHLSFEHKSRLIGAEMYWWWPSEGKDRIFGDIQIELPQVLVVQWKAEGNKEDAELAAWLRENDLRAFVMSRGLNGVKDLKERGELLEKFFTLPELSVATRFKALENAGDQPEQQPAFGPEFRRLAADVVADPRNDANFGNYIDTLFRLSAKNDALRKDLYAALGDNLYVVTLAAAGTTQQTVELALNDVTRFRKVVVLQFENSKFQDLILNFGVIPNPDQPGRLSRLDGRQSSSVLSVKDLGKDAQVVKYRRERFGADKEQFWACSWETRPVDMDQHSRDTYELETASHIRVDQRQLVIDIRYLGESRNKVAFETRLTELGKLKDDAHRATAEELAKLLTGLDGTPEWSGCALKLYKAAPESFPQEMLWTLDFSEKPGADGLLRVKAERTFKPERSTRHPYLTMQASGFQYLVVGKIADRTLVFPLIMTPIRNTNAYRTETDEVVDLSSNGESIGRETVRVGFWAHGNGLRQSGMSRPRDVVPPLALERGEVLAFQRRIDPVNGVVQLKVIAKP